jgi:hypothetical protein
VFPLVQDGKMRIITNSKNRTKMIISKEKNLISNIIIHLNSPYTLTAVSYEGKDKKIVWKSNDHKIC